MIIQRADTRPEPLCGSETWLPIPARILDVRVENENTRSYRVQIVDEHLRGLYRWSPGQFNMLYVPGVGEAAISISSDPAYPEVLEHTVRIVGSVTRALDRVGEGGLIGLRGPFGQGWPLDRLDGHDVVMMAGGIGLAPIRRWCTGCFVTATAATGWCCCSGVARLKIGHTLRS